MMGYSRIACGSDDTGLSGMAQVNVTLTVAGTGPGHRNSVQEHGCIPRYNSA